MRALSLHAVRSQRGVALVTVLLVFAVVAILAAEMLQRSQLNLRSVDNLITSRQAYDYALGGEVLARQLLAEDVIQGHGAVDSLDEPWAQVGQREPFPIAGGAIHVQIHDLQGRFNLNDVVDARGVPASGAWLQDLQQLCVAVGVDVAFADRWRDWVDRDQVALPGGAEDAAYPHYLTAGGPEADVSALRLLKDLQPQDYDRLAPHVAALPPGTLINVNTADADVLRALGPIISAHADQILARQQQGGFADLAAFQALVGTGVDTSQLAVRSDYFEVVATVEYLDRFLRLRTVLRRDGNTGAITVLSRTREPFAGPGDTSTTSDNTDQR